VVALSDGRRVVSGSYDKTLRVWDVDTGECVRELKGHGSVSEWPYHIERMILLVGLAVS
jgi:WD40 repeat protein